MDGGARWATVHGVTKSQTRLRSSSSIKRVIPYPLENPMDKGAWQATVLGVAKSWTRQARVVTRRSNPTPKEWWLPGRRRA